MNIPNSRLYLMLREIKRGTLFSVDDALIFIDEKRIWNAAKDYYELVQSNLVEARSCGGAFKRTYALTNAGATLFDDLIEWARAEYEDYIAAVKSNV